MVTPQELAIEEINIGIRHLKGAMRRAHESFGFDSISYVKQQWATADKDQPAEPAQPAPAKKRVSRAKK